MIQSSWSTLVKSAEGPVQILCVALLLFLCPVAFLSAEIIQDDQEIPGAEASVADSAVVIADTAVVGSVVEKAHAEVEEAEPSSESLEEGYKGLRWGASREVVSSHLGADIAGWKTGGFLQVSVALGEDSAEANYFCNDNGFWKVRIDYNLGESSMEAAVKGFRRVEGYLTRRYGSPKRTTRNDWGTDREYLFSAYPRLAHGYYRSSWSEGAVNMELVLEAHVGEEGSLLAFTDLRPNLYLYYYHTGLVPSGTTASSVGSDTGSVLKAY